MKSFIGRLGIAQRFLATSLSNLAAASQEMTATISEIAGNAE